MGTNVFYLWKEKGEDIPFKIRRVTWNPDNDLHILVTKIEIEKWPYGIAWGVYIKNGKKQKEDVIDCAGNYSWEFFEEN